MKLFQKFFLSFHIISVVFLVISPLFVSNSFKKQYGNNISIIMFLIMSSWLLLKELLWPPLSLYRRLRYLRMKI